MCVTNTRVSGRGSEALANSSRQTRMVSSERSPVSTRAQPSPSEMAHRLIWSSAKVNGRRDFQGVALCGWGIERVLQLRFDHRFDIFKTVRHRKLHEKMP